MLAPLGAHYVPDLYVLLASFLMDSNVDTCDFERWYFFRCPQMWCCYSWEFDELISFWNYNYPSYKKFNQLYTLKEQWGSMYDLYTQFYKLHRVLDHINPFIFRGLCGTLLYMKVKVKIHLYVTLLIKINKSCVCI